VNLADQSAGSRRRLPVVLACCLEVGDTAGWETCATPAMGASGVL